MFEILQALRDLNEACRKHGTRLTWEINTIGEPPLLHAEIPLTEDDVEFTNNMQALFAPVED